MSIPKNFRVIVIGGGPVGLALGHGLSAANIDFVILEKHHNIINDSGAAIMLWPHSIRIFDQLGLLAEVKKMGMSVHAKANTLLNGKVTGRANLFDMLEEAHGYPCLNFNRPKLTRVLYEGLPSREERIKTNATVVDIETHDHGVRVLLSDGSVEEGSIVIGADGVHSTTPDAVQLPGAVWPRRLHRGHGEFTFFETRGTGMTTQMTAFDDSIHFSLCRTLAEPTTERKMYTAEETAEMAVDFANVQVMTNLKFKDVWPKCNWTRLVNQNEGWVDKWHHGRVMLVGDGVHCMMPNAGMGLNCSIQSVVCLVNELSDALKSNENLDCKGIDGVFSRYEKIRKEEAKIVYDMSRMIVRGTTWSSWMAWLMDQCFVPYVGQENMVRKRVSGPVISQGRVFNFIPWDGGSKGTIPWVHTNL
ncbi:uncharacterized protein BCR38DRAFT_491018 [Pseudomassariella vexata]|uniref:FAD-binding domain-containing protein n=1 Tax=Pseudomassariella vexata TaxID=1141098 RepID=A0A1Y2D8Z3_9PEZI|nr:uncharacterized protein BCR38DRAFT_491018 [Pseudomassariella vexata]ORY55677.1 hypothetical protein BCR38DRAFT_491018 [Pseudomassariella vexata]